MADATRKSAEMSDEELSAILDSEMRQSLGGDSTELTADREENLKYFYGEKYGNEEEGFSQVVTREVQDTVEWVLPALLKIFMGGETVVEFNPRGPEDEEAAKQRTDYVNYIFQQDNPGFKILYTAFKDALIQKNGVVKVYYDDKALDETRTLTGIDDEAYTALIDDPDVGEENIIEHTTRPAEGDEYASPAETIGPSAAGAGGAMPSGAVPPAAAMMGGAPAMPPPQPAMLHDVKYTKRGGGKVCVESIAPEEFLISKRARDIPNSPYVGDRRRKRLSDLIAEGLITEAEALAIGSDEAPDLTGEAETRARTGDDTGMTQLSDREGVMREVWVTDHYLLVDADGDGIAERLRVTTAGSTGNIILREEWEGPPPYASGSPILVTHRVIGQALADQVKDLQLITSTVTRQILNNLYRTNIPRTYLRDGVDIDDYLNPQPGGYTRVPGNPNEYVKEQTVPFTAAASLPILEHLQTVRENRTGVTRYNQGIDANSLNKTAAGITQIMTAAQQRIELIARILAETFVRDLFMLIDHCTTKYQNKARVVRIRNKWVTVDPRQWESNFDMTINVGLGTGNKDMQLQHLQMILGMQAQVIQLQGGLQGPLVKIDHVHHALTKLTENAGFKNADAFWGDPQQAALEPPPPPKPDPEMAKVEQQGKIEMAKLQQKDRVDQANLKMTAQRNSQEMILKFAEANASLELKKADQRQNQALSRDKMQGEQGLARDRMNGEQSLARDTAEAPIKDASKLAGDTVQMLISFIEKQRERDERQDQLLRTILENMNAPREIVRGPDGRVSGMRSVPPGMPQ